jgi:hypothetical protein
LDSTSSSKGKIPEFVLHSRQGQAWVNLTQKTEVKEVLFGGAKNGGKSFLGATWICSSALLYPETFYFIARKELHQIKSFTIPTIMEWFKLSGLKMQDYCTYNGFDNRFNFNNGSKIYLISCTSLPSDPLYERFGSMQFTQGWIEEGGEIPDAAYENLKLSIGRWNNDRYSLPYKLLITCNPKKNWMYREFFRPHKEGSLPKEKAFIQSLVTDNDFRQSGSVEVLDAIKDTKARARLRFGEWEYEDDPSNLMDFESIDSIFTNTHIKAEGKKYIVCDVARFGSDKSVIRVWHGLRVIKREVYSGKDTRFIADRIRELSNDFQVPMMNVVIDEDGIGGGVVDQLTGAKGFVANSSPINPKPSESYDNLKSQCAYKLAELVNQNMIYEDLNGEDRQKLVEELQQIKEKDTGKEGKRGVVSKDKIKAMIGRSPDDADTYIMRMFFEVKQSVIARMIQPQHTTSRRSDFYI